MARYVSHVPDGHDSDPHVYDVVMDEVVEALLVQSEADGRAGELNADSSTDPRYNVEGWTPDPAVEAAGTLSQAALVEAANEAVYLGQEGYPNAEFAEGVTSTYNANLTESLPFPMPRTHLAGGTVIASVQYIEDERGSIALILLLRDDGPPFYEVAHYALTDFDPTQSGDPFLREGTAYKAGEWDTLGKFQNIVPAVKEYKDSGGDY